jgi:hypothetical protein
MILKLTADFRKINYSSVLVASSMYLSLKQMYYSFEVRVF